MKTKITDNRGLPGLLSSVLLLTGLAFYLFFAFYDGVVIAVDSPTYITMSLSREPFYPMLLAFFRLILGSNEGVYLFGVVIAQSLLAGFSAWYMTMFLRREFRLPGWLTCLIFLIPLAVSLLCRFAAGRASMYSNSILTEGIAISLYLILARELLAWFFHNTRWNLIAACILSFVMISSRKQMYVTLGLIVLAVLAASLLRRRFLAGLFRAALISFLILMSVSLLDKGYNYALRGTFVRHTSDIRFVMTMVFYTAEREDAMLITDPEIRDLFLSIYDACEEKNYLAHSAGEGWLNEVSHFGDNYDFIQIQTMGPRIQAYAESIHDGVYVDAVLESDRIMRTMIREVLPNVSGKIAVTLCNNFLSGLVTTVAQRKPVLILYTVLAYVAFLALTILMYLAGRAPRRAIHSPIGSTPDHADIPAADCSCATPVGCPAATSASCPATVPAGSTAAHCVLEESGATAESLLHNRRALVFSCYTILSILINVLLVSAVIFCQTRYTIYNMPLFYMSFLIMLYQAFLHFRDKRARS